MLIVADAIGCYAAGKISSQMIDLGLVKILGD